MTGLRRRLRERLDGAVSGAGIPLRTIVTVAASGFARIRFASRSRPSKPRIILFVKRLGSLLAMRDADLLATVELVAAHEGFRQFPYADTRGNETIGHGRNLKGKGIRRSEARLLLLDDIFDAVKHLTTTYPWFEKLDAVRQAALIDMMMMGSAHFDAYHNMTTFLARGMYREASGSAHVVGWGDERNREVTNMISTGRWPDKVGESMADAGEQAVEAAQIATEVLNVAAPGLGSILAAIAALIGGVEHSLGKGHPTTVAASAHLAEAHKQIAAAMPAQPAPASAAASK